MLLRNERTFLLWPNRPLHPMSHPGITERDRRESLEFNSNQFEHVPSMFYYQQFRKAVWINKAAVSLNYQYIKMDLWTTKDCLAELLFPALFHGENWGVISKSFPLEMQSELPNVPEDTVNYQWLSWQYC